MYDTAGILGVPLDRFPEYITDLEYRIKALLKDIDVLKTKKQEVLKQYKMTSESLEEYNANKPLIGENHRLKLALAKAEEALEFEKLSNKIAEDLEWSPCEEELVGINRELGNSNCHYIDGSEILKIGDLKEMVREIYHRPSEYPELIRDMIYEYGLRHERQKARAKN